MAPVSQLILDQMICMSHSKVWLMLKERLAAAFQEDT